MNTKTKAASPGRGVAAQHKTLSPQSNDARTKTQARVLSGRPHKTKRSTAAQVLERLEAAKRILEAIQPCSVRAVCYQLFNAKLITDMSKNATNAISRQLARAREEGIIPWSWIVDETRAAERPSRWQDPSSIVDAAVRGYRRDNWQDQPVRVEVWAEKGTVRGTLAPVLDELGVVLRVMHGFSSATVVNDIAQESVNGDVPMIALYIGDFDPSGMSMSERDLPSRLYRYGADVDLRRICLMREDIDEIPQFDASTKVGDPNHGWFVERYGDRCAELDAMRPPDLRERVRAAIVAEMDTASWNRALEVEAVEIESMREFHAAWLGRAARMEAGYGED